ncbi:Uu.00g090100.m01.CDS01 [Anthostomella pinea]|uniref:Uu.00g090100.m01.CDS01 n=1 Tax=Anthostomella pinea TaxID=933095 RepID=A0AAI8VMT5_9PEZI|nr:Uu.00g090100.m01.CDS01 [Anthostomella pinea]
MAGEATLGNGGIMSSPVPNDNSRLLSPPRASNGKERRNPPITPRRFRRFFTPRSRVPSPAHLSPARKALQVLAGPELNHRQRYQTPAPSSPLRPLSEEQIRDENLDLDLDLQDDRLAKRRKCHHTLESSPCRPPPLPASSDARSGLLSPIRSLHPSQEICESDEEMSDDELLSIHQPVKRLVPLTSRGLTGQLAQRQLGGMPRAGRSHMSYPTADWRVETADFHSRPDDVHNCISHDGPGQCIPFCVATCNRSSLTAVGDEEGRVRLLDSSGHPQEPFSKIHLTLQAHTNAIIDLAFSDDDYLLATASGDQMGRVIDMMTQTTVAFLPQHTASLKQIRFQPGQANSSVLATSSRDGSVQIWDLRCSRPAHDFSLPESRETNLVFRRPQAKRGCAVNSLYQAHAHTPHQVRQAHFIGYGDTPSRGELPGRANDISVTALQFLPAGQEHLLLTACEADASIKLWDIRSIHSSRTKVPSPLSATAPPESHSTYRPFGISSLALSTDASRLYALCKDNTVYAYSTAHLMLGHAPELSSRGEPPRRRQNVVTQQGLGPLYGFRHPSFHATSFYVKCAIRPARDGKSELLAVGSSDNCAVLFPTDERQFRDELSGAMGSMSLENSTIATAPLLPAALASFASTPAANTRASGAFRKPLFPANNSTNLSARLNDNIPIVRTGTPLVRGHEREVGSLAWTNQGKLVTVGDDYLIRCWSERRDDAADLRTGGETGGRRWGCGWADVGDDWDQPDDDED